MKLLKVYVSTKNGSDHFYMDPTDIYLQIVKQAYIRFGTQAIARIVTIN